MPMLPDQVRILFLLVKQQRRADLFTQRFAGCLATRESIFRRRSTGFSLDSLRTLYFWPPNRTRGESNRAQHLRRGSRPSRENTLWPEDDLLGRSNAALEQRDALPCVRPDKPQPG